MPGAFDGHSFILGAGTESGLVRLCGRVGEGGGVGGGAVLRLAPDVQ